MTDNTPQKLQLSPAQIAGSALAAVSGAFLASVLGTTGTIIGAALGSVIATVGAATYTYSLRRTSAAVLRTAAQVRETGMSSTVVIPRLPGHQPRLPEPTGTGSGAPTDDGSTDPRDEGRFATLRGLPWVKVALAAAAVMVVAMAGITAFEAVTGKPVSAYTGGSSSTGTSVGGLLGQDRSTSDQQPTDGSTRSPSPSPSPSPSGSPTSEPTAVPSGEPSGEPTGDPSGAPTGTPTPAPSPTVDPTPSATPTP